MNRKWSFLLCFAAIIGVTNLACAKDYSDIEGNKVIPVGKHNADSITIEQTQAVTNNGNLTVNGDISTANQSKIINNNKMTVDGSIYFSNKSQINNSENMIVNGDITAEGNGKASNNCVQINNSSGSQMTVNGSVDIGNTTLKNEGKLTTESMILNDNSTVNNLGTLRVGSLSTDGENTSINNTSGTLVFIGDGSTNSTTITGGDITLDATIVTDEDGYYQGNSVSFTNDGTINDVGVIDIKAAVAVVVEDSDTGEKSGYEASSAFANSANAIVNAKEIKIGAEIKLVKNNDEDGGYTQEPVAAESSLSNEGTINATNIIIGGKEISYFASSDDEEKDTASVKGSLTNSGLISVSGKLSNSGNIINSGIPKEDEEAPSGIRGGGIVAAAIENGVTGTIENEGLISAGNLKNEGSIQGNDGVL